MMKSSRRSLSAAVIYLLSLLGTISTAEIFMTSVRDAILFDEPLVIAVTAAAWAAAVFVFGVDHKTKIVNILSAAMVSAVPCVMIIRFSALTSGLSGIVGEFTEYVTKNDLHQKVIAGSDENFVLCIVMILCTFVCVYSVTISHRLLPVLIVTLPLTEICLFFGLVPVWTAFIGIMIFWGGTAASEKAAEAAARSDGGRSVVYQSVALGAVFIAFSATVGFTAAAVHNRSEAVRDLRKMFLTYTSDLSFESFTTDLKNTVFPPKDHKLTHDGDLGNIDEIVFDGDTIFEVTVPESAQIIYLKGFTGDRYNGTGWRESEYVPELSTQITSAEFFPMRVLREFDGFDDLEPLYMIVRNTEQTPKPRYFPSYAAGLLESDGVRRKYWGYFPSGDWQTKVILTASTQLLPREMCDDERLLREEAYEDCLDVPGSFDCAESFFEDYDGTDMLEELSYIRKKLSDECEYTLESGRRPIGKDFAKWFLTENKKGSCTHFATAAVLLCRSRGIPARYCEGFIVDPKDGGRSLEDGYITMAVPDNRAHAWAEIYINGFGWMVFESTPGYGNMFRMPDDSFGFDEISSEMTEVSTAAPVHESELTVSMPTETTAAETVTEMTVTASETTTVTEANIEETEPSEGAETTSDTESGSETGFEISAEPSVTESLSGSGEDHHSEEQRGKKRNSVLKAILIIFFAAALIAGIYFGIRRLRKQILISHRRLLKDDPDKTVRIIYRHFTSFAAKHGIDIRLPNDLTYKSFEGICDIQMAEHIISAAMEMQYGKGTTVEKARLAVDCYNSIMDVYCSQKGMRYIFMRTKREVFMEYRI